MTGAQKVWRRLRRYQRFKLLLRLAARYQRLWRDHGVAAVGAGYRTLTSSDHVQNYRKSHKLPKHVKARTAKLVRSKQRIIIVTRELCLRVLLSLPRLRAAYKERKYAKGKRKWVVPREVLTSVRVGGRLRRCAVPTDVETLGHIHTHARIDALAMDSSAVFGSACCMVQTTGSAPEPLLLGCNHVFTTSDVRQGNEAQQVTLSHGGSRIADLYDYTRLRPPGGGTGFDAALARPAANANMPPWLPMPTKIFGSSDPPWNVQIISYSQTRNAIFGGFLPSLSIQYGSQWIDVGPLYEFHDVDTQPGDSGAAVLAGNLLVCLHIAGDTGLRKAYGHPAAAVFKSGRFNVSIELP